MKKYEKIRTEKAIVQSFYDKFGWQEDAASQQYMDGCIFEDLREVTQAYRARANQRVREALVAKGELMLDVASGPIQYDDYLQFSAGYQKRVCVDFSMRGLKGARKRINEHGFYVLADITRLPFKDDSFDGIVSLHTLYHVPADEQSTAMRELYRTLKPNQRAVVVYKWPYSLLNSILAFPQPVLKRIRRIILRLPGTRFLIMQVIKPFLLRDQSAASQSVTRPSPPPLYFHAHDRKWFKQQFDHLFCIEMRCWRSVDVSFLKRITDRARGRRILHLIQQVEDKWPHLLGRIGSYPLLVLYKAAGAHKSE